MFRGDRAKQFLSFDALKGLREELKKREEKFLLQTKKQLTDEEVRELNCNLIKLRKDDLVKIVFYYNGKYLSLQGVVAKKNSVYKYLTIGEAQIPFEDITSLQIL